MPFAALLPGCEPFYLARFIQRRKASALFTAMQGAVSLAKKSKANLLSRAAASRASLSGAAFGASVGGGVLMTTRKGEDDEPATVAPERELRPCVGIAVVG